MKRDLISIFAMFAKFDELCARFSTKANIASSETHYLIKLQKRARLKYSFLNGQVKLLRMQSSWIRVETGNRDKFAPLIRFPINLNVCNNVHPHYRI